MQRARATRRWGPAGAARPAYGGAAASVFVSAGHTGWASPASAATPRARFHALTWAYFLALPYKLDDPGTVLEELGEGRMGDRQYPIAQLSFAPGVGDAPDDWYVLYRDPSTSRLEAAAYIVTYGQDPSAVTAKDAHAIRYEDFEDVEGVPVARHWTFHNWSRAEGPGEPLIGEARLARVRFVDAPAGAFVAPEGAAEIPLPR